MNILVGIYRFQGGGGNIGQYCTKVQIMCARAYWFFLSLTYRSQWRDNIDAVSKFCFENFFPISVEINAL